MVSWLTEMFWNISKERPKCSEQSTQHSNWQLNLTAAVNVAFYQSPHQLMSQHAN